MPRYELSFASTLTATTIAFGVCFVGGLACVDSSRARPLAMCEATPPVATSSATIPTEDNGAVGPYEWKNVVIKGGGFVSGIVMSPALPGLVFARTDVGGAYRYNPNPSSRRWMPITDWVGHNDVNLTGIESIALDPTDPNRVYIAAGEYLTAGNGVILSSIDMGQTFTRNPISAPMGGNVDGRSMGERLAVDPNLPSTLYFGSRNAGLWKSVDSAQTWSRVNEFPTTGALNESGVASYGLTFVFLDRRSGTPGSATPTIYVGVGVTNQTETALYRTTNAGATWEAVAGQPVKLMPHHAVADGCDHLFIAYNDGPGPNNIKAGAVWRLSMNDGKWTDVSPPLRGGGFGGIAADAAHPGTLIATTIDYWSPGEVWRTTNGGTTWLPIMGSTKQHSVAGAEWLWWHGANLPAAGWMGDVEIDPFNPDRALYITGQGIWSSDDVTAADAGGAPHWNFDNDGLEETVALDLASPPTGAPLLSAVGDIAGFRHDDLDVSPPGGIYSNPIFGNTNSLDFAEAAADIVARVGTNSAKGGVRGAHSVDGGTTWTPFATEPAGSTGSGSIAVAADGKTFLWAPQGGTPSYSHDQGSTWIACTGIAAGARVAADRVNPAKFYAAARSRMYVSIDGGATFTPTNATTSGRPRPVFGVEGDLWFTTNSGLFHSQDSAATFTQVPQVSGATAVGFGMAAPGQSYPAVYVAGLVGGIWGTYRSDDVGVTWQRIDDPQHQFGWVNVLAGDSRRFGRVYIGTGGRGILYGDAR